MPSTMLTPTDHTDRTGHGAAATVPDYRLAVDRTVVAPGKPAPFTFRVIGPDGRPVTAFADRHERPMHTIVVSHDAADYAHLHPQLGAGGEWNVELPALAAGGYRLYADTAPAGGPDLLLTVDLVVPGRANGAPLPEPERAVTVDDLTVAVDLARSATGVTAALTVRRYDAVVEADPYLGARGHLVAIATTELDYLHVHPTDATGAAVTFAIEDPSPGRYRLFFDFSVEGEVRTAAFTVDLTPAVEPAATTMSHTHTPGEEHR
jgi:hypothetical protein